MTGANRTYDRRGARSFLVAAVIAAAVTVPPVAAASAPPSITEPVPTQSPTGEQRGQVTLGLLSAALISAVVLGRRARARKKK